MFLITTLWPVDSHRSAYSQITGGIYQTGAYRYVRSRPTASSDRLHGVLAGIPTIMERGLDEYRTKACRCSGVVTRSSDDAHSRNG